MRLCRWVWLLGLAVSVWRAVEGSACLMGLGVSPPLSPPYPRLYTPANPPPIPHLGRIGGILPPSIRRMARFVPPLPP